MQAYRRFLILTVALAAVLSLVAAWPCAAQVTPLAPADLGVCDNGELGVGMQGFIWQNGVMTGLPALEGYTGSRALDINTSGQVVGLCAGEGIQACIWNYEAGAWTATGLGFLSDSGSSLAVAINDAGQVIGDTGMGGFIWDSVNGIAPLLYNGAPIYAITINEQGQVLGDLEDTNNTPVIWQDGIADLHGHRHRPGWRCAHLQPGGERAGRRRHRFVDGRFRLDASGRRRLQLRREGDRCRRTLRHQDGDGECVGPRHLGRLDSEQRPDRHRHG